MEDALPLAPGTAPSRRAEGLIGLSSCPAPPCAARGVLCKPATSLLCPLEAVQPGHALAEHPQCPNQQLPSRPRISVRPRQHLLAGKRVQVLGSPSPFLRTAPTRGESSRLGHHAQRGDPWGVPHPSSLVPCPLSLVPRCRDRTAHSRHATDISQASR